MNKIFELLDNILEETSKLSREELLELFAKHHEQRVQSKKPRKIKITDGDEIIATVKDKDVSKCDSAFGFQHACALARTKALICKSTLNKYLLVDSTGTIALWTEENGFSDGFVTLEDVLDAKYDIVGKIGF